MCLGEVPNVCTRYSTAVAAYWHTSKDKTCPDARPLEPSSTWDLSNTHMDGYGSLRVIISPGNYSLHRNTITPSHMGRNPAVSKDCYHAWRQVRVRVRVQVHMYAFPKPTAGTVLEISKQATSSLLYVPRYSVSHWIPIPIPILLECSRGPEFLPAVHHSRRAPTTYVNPSREVSDSHNYLIRDIRTFRGEPEPQPEAMLCVEPHASIHARHHL